MLVSRLIQANIIQQIKDTDKIHIIFGPRQVGKTTLAKNIIKEL